jgi:hypothetical protein
MPPSEATTLPPAGLGQTKSQPGPALRCAQHDHWLRLGAADGFGPRGPLNVGDLIEAGIQRRGHRLMHSGGNVAADDPSSDVRILAPACSGSCSAA